MMNQVKRYCIILLVRAFSVLIINYFQIDSKKRVHFHSFMFDIHSRIHEVKKNNAAKDKGKRMTKPEPFDPIPPVARDISDSYWLICFDEFQVN